MQLNISKVKVDGEKMWKSVVRINRKGKTAPVDTGFIDNLIETPVTGELGS